MGSKPRRVSKSPSRGIPRQTNSGSRVKRNRAVNPLVRLEKKRPIRLSLKIKRTNQNTDQNSANPSRATVDSEPDELTMKEILGELYGDKVYLQKFIKETGETKQM